MKYPSTMNVAELLDKVQWVNIPEYAAESPLPFAGALFADFVLAGGAPRGYRGALHMAQSHILNSSPWRKARRRRMRHLKRR